ncbi:MAG: DUF6252 family protein [Nonlabens sp.]
MIKSLKTLSFFLFSILIFTSCDKNLDEDNTPAINANRNGEFFGAEQMVAVQNADGSLTITGVNPLEQLVINLESANLGTYPLGPGSPNEAIYVFNNTNTFTSNRGFGRGEVQLRSSEAPNSISGSFDFVSYLPGQVDSLYMRRGIIYQVPFGDPIGIDPGDDFSTVFTALIDGVGFTPVGVVPIVANGNITVNAANDQRQFIALTFPEDVAVGTYDLASSSGYSATYNADGANTERAESGFIQITAVDANAQTIVGTFEFTTGGTPSFEITEGNFSIEY